MRIVKCILPIFLASIIFAGCEKTAEHPPDFVIKTGKTDINYIINTIDWNGNDFYYEEEYNSIIETEGENSIPVIPLNEVITIDFKGAVPTSIELTNKILNKNGDMKYTEKENQTIPIKISKEQGTFILIPNPAALLSSNSEDYEAGATVRGFKLNCKWDDNECEYLFVLKTDAK